MHGLHLAGRARHRVTPRREGVVVQLNRSGGGVPKTPVDEALVTARGLEGDLHDDRRNHGRPWQAVCLWSAEVIDALAAEGHPIGYGSAGENVTVSGLDWSALTPGARVQVGDALLQVSSYAIPCSKNAHWFSDGGFRRMSHEVNPAGSRLYASVVRGGRVRAGDPVVLEP
jgi:MOSC domain-containing protein YiiM